MDNCHLITCNGPWLPLRAHRPEHARGTTFTGESMKVSVGKPLSALAAALRSKLSRSASGEVHWIRGQVAQKSHRSVCYVSATDQIARNVYPSGID